LIQQTLPKLQQHRQRAYRLLDEVKANPNQLGVGGSGAAGNRSNQGGPARPGQ
jgi:hypothetical protein